MNHEEKRKGEFQHKLFKFAVLIIVFVFFCLIVGFIYVEFFGSANTDTTNAIFEINNERYNYLNSIDQSFYHQNDIQIAQCNISSFYIDHISNNIPCIISYEKATEEYRTFIESVSNHRNNKEQLSLISFVNYLLKFIQIKIGKEINNLSIATSDSRNKFFINLSEKEKNTFTLSPISQINKLNPYKNETYREYGVIYAKEDLFTLSNEIILFSVELKKGDMLYVPSYYFVEMKEKEYNDMILYEYNNNNKLMEIAFKALFDDNVEINNDEGW